MTVSILYIIELNYSIIFVTCNYQIYVIYQFKEQILFFFPELRIFVVYAKTFTTQAIIKPAYIMEETYLLFS